ncbi:hypothetical protein DXI23_11545 [Marinobacter flavimaris]|uniref:Uncharacterized protein n=1 Tax=Marinobacter flavimaris TaxID=262076 RepID=A0A3D8H3B2_9GAMM|nr:hypothetical protein [Marinobacter flavimaris]PPI78456.1 hypothetical protein MDHKLMBL_19930 [Marinobacter flavimaris]RDU41148.1 hypothetical protein DXI23_11545 [Marinobacter flavimaris]
MTTLKKLQAFLPGKKLNDPSATLFTSKAFWYAICVPVLLSTTLIWIASLNSSLTPDLSAEGLAVFYDLFKLPIAIAGLSIPCAALVASHLRSIQTTAQINQQKEQLNQQAEQNSFSNSLEHRKQFLSFFERMNPFEDLECLPGWKLYDNLFPDAPDGQFHLNPDIEYLIEQIQEATTDLKSVAIKFEIEHHYEPGFALMQAETIRHNIYELTRITITNLHRATNVPMNKLHDIGLELQGVTMGLVNCANFHATTVNEGKFRAVMQAIYGLVDQTEYRARCERIREGMLFALPESVSGKGVEQQLESAREAIKSILEREAAKKAFKVCDPLILDQEVLWVIRYELPKEKRMYAWLCLPESLKEATKKLPEELNS